MKIRNALRKYGVISDDAACMIHFILPWTSWTRSFRKENCIESGLRQQDMRPYSMAVFRRRVKHGSGI